MIETVADSEEFIFVCTVHTQDESGAGNGSYSRCARAHFRVVIPSVRKTLAGRTIR